jgi:hypothetical protein
MFTAVELIDVWIDAVAHNGVRWRSHSMLVATMSHFPELELDLELLRFRCNADLTEDEADAL